MPILRGLKSARIFSTYIGGKNMIRYELSEGTLMVEALSTGVMLKLFSNGNKLQRILEIEDLIKIVKGQE